MSFDNKEELSYKEQIEKFLGDKDNYSLFIKGKWGVGKTYLWKEIENEISNTKKDFELNKIKFNLFSHLIYLYKFIVFIFKFIFKYFSYYEFVKQEDKSLRVIYISLFGKEHYKEILEEITLNSFNHNKLIYFLRNLTFWKISVGSLIQFFIKQDFKNIIVCFDDLERKSNKLNIKDLLGLINKLKEEKCKVILIGDDSKLNNKTFDDYKEKCIDLEITIESRFEVISQIIKEKCPRISTKLIPYGLLSYIKNLRQLNKITRSFNYFHEELHFEERLKENPNLKDFFIYVFEVITEKIDNTCKIERSLEVQHLFIKSIEEIIKDYYKNATYLISNTIKEAFNNQLTNYQFYIYRVEFIQILSVSIQTNKFNNKDSKEKIDKILKYITDRNKINDFVDLSRISIVDFFAFANAFKLHDNKTVGEIKKAYIRRFYGDFDFIKLFLSMEQNKNNDLLEEFNKMVKHFNNSAKDNYMTPEEEVITSIKNYQSFINTLENKNTVQNQALYEKLKNNEITSYYLDYLFLFKKNQEKFQSLYNEYKNYNKS